MSKPTLEERFWAKVEKTNGCWNWTASRVPQGYGQFTVQGAPRRAHRVSYEMAFGPIPKGMEIDHLCFNTSCVNPKHLRVATSQQNKQNRSGPQRNNIHSGVRGVGKNRSGWVVRIGHNGKVHFFGTYPTIEEAEQVAIRERARLYDPLPAISI
ncbi:HNH endonuclease signature motif containing protein [Kocuria sp. CCUG 69068]|uniref:HNH endonuclease signature motif containing protein n=1 Tax=Kocuria sp. CCUG 69068 TaxID=2043138 RepID=UPI001E62B3A5